MNPSSIVVNGDGFRVTVTASSSAAGSIISAIIDATLAVGDALTIERTA